MSELPAVANFASFYSEGPYGGYVRGQRDLGSSSACLTEIEQPAGDFPDPANPDLVLALSLRPIRGCGDQGAGRFRFNCPSGQLAVAPPHVATRFTLDCPNRFLVLSIPFDEVRQLLASDSLPIVNDFGPLHRGTFGDSLISTLLTRLWHEVAVHGDHSSLFIDSAVATLLHALRAAAVRATPCPRTMGGLTGRQLARVEDYLRTDPQGDFSLVELASLIGMSPFHFARAFKASTGLPPHRYQTMLRAERAKEMLVSTSLSVTEIASECGFASSQHMATVFRKMVGATPTAYRRDRRS